MFPTEVDFSAEGVTLLYLSIEVEVMTDGTMEDEGFVGITFSVPEKVANLNKIRPAWWKGSAIIRSYVYLRD